MSDYPRTDAARAKTIPYKGDMLGLSDVVYAPDMEQLERENADLRKQLAEKIDQLIHLVSYEAQLIHLVSYEAAEKRNQSEAKVPKEIVARLKAMLAAEQISRDIQRRENHPDLAAVHGDRAQMLREVLDWLAVPTKPD